MVGEITAPLSLRFGPQVATWCSGVPVLADEVAARWGLKLGEAYAYGASSVVLHCSQAGGTSAVLKLSPDPPFLADQAAILIAERGYTRAAVRASRVVRSGNQGQRRAGTGPGRRVSLTAGWRAARPDAGAGAAGLYGGGGGG